jgi:hypothetical protein
MSVEAGLLESGLVVEKLGSHLLCAKVPAAGFKV